MTVILTELPVNLPDATGSGKSKMAAFELQNRIPHFVRNLTLERCIIIFVNKIESVQIFEPSLQLCTDAIIVAESKA
jgi:hypothetical protein